MRIFEINVFRDGGSIEFHIERDGQTRKVRLDTAFRGEPRELRIDSVPVGRGDPAVNQLLADIDEWWKTLTPKIQQKVQEVMAHKGPRFNPDTEAQQASDLEKVLLVRNYVAQTYAA